MSTTLMIAAAVLAAAAGAVAFFANRQPDSFEVRRSLVIAAAPARIYPLIDSFHNWSDWSPWEALDPDMTRRFDGPASGPGAIYAWDGKKAGAGRMIITEARQDQFVLIDLVFTKPFRADNVARFELTPDGPNTAVRWSMTGRSPFISKVMGLIFSMDKMVGGDFEKGLAALKIRAEQPA